MVKPIRRSKPPKPDPAYQQLWRTIEGAVRDALQMHPEYVANGKPPRVVVNSITKRVTGSIISLADSNRVKARVGWGSAERETGMRAERMDVC